MEYSLTKIFKPVKDDLHSLYMTACIDVGNRSWRWNCEDDELRYKLKTKLILSIQRRNYNLGHNTKGNPFHAYFECQNA